VLYRRPQGKTADLRGKPSPSDWCVRHVSKYLFSSGLLPAPTQQRPVLNPIFPSRRR
jgi:hypothetical protein